MYTINIKCVYVQLETKEVMFTENESNQPIVHISISDMVADKLRDGIMNGTFRFNQKLVETDLCKKMEVSRTPIRKAFDILIKEGLIKRIQGSGVVVVYREREIKHYWEVIEILLKAAMERIITNITETEVDELKAIQNKLEEKWDVMKNSDLNEPDIQEMLSVLDTDFHTVLINANGNPILVECIDLICRKGNLCKWKELSEESILEHRIMLTAIKDKDIVQADNIIGKHLICNPKQKNT